MAYTYTPQFYNPYQPLQIQQPSQPQTSLIWVPSEKAAWDYPVAPNTALPIWDSNDPVLYLKTADASGRPSMKIYDLVERSSEKKDSVFDVKGAMVELYGMLKEIKEDIAKMKKEDDE